MIVQLRLCFTIFLVTSAVYGEDVQVASHDANNAPVNKDNIKLPIKTDGSSVNDNSANVNLGRSDKVWDSTSDIIKCAVSLDGACLLNAVEDIVNKAQKKLMSEADAQFERQFSGRKKKDDKNESPTALISSLTQIVFDVPELLRDSISGLSGFIKSGGNLSYLEDDDEDDTIPEKANEEEEEADKDDENDDDDEDEKDDDDDDNDDDDDEEETEVEETVNDDDEEEAAEEDEGDKNTAAENSEDNETENDENVTEESSELRTPKRSCKKKKGRCVAKKNRSGDFELEKLRELGVGRNKKKKKKKALLRLFAVIMLIKAKLAMLLKLVATKLQFKFLLIAFANLLINGARFWWDLKKGHEQPQKVIYYEHAQHQHHYDHDDWHGGGGGGGGYWGRSYEEEDKNTAPQNVQQLAYTAYTQPLPTEDSDTKIDTGGYSWNPWSS